MQKKLKSSDIARPFSRAILSRARKIAIRYHVVIEEVDGLFLGSGLEMPLVMADGSTAGQCVKNTRAALLAATAALIERGDPVPAPLDQQKRAAQLDLRFTGAEKRVIESAARQKGYEGIAEFLRVTALGAAKACTQ